jgi:hypothetical protein
VSSLLLSCSSLVRVVAGALVDLVKWIEPLGKNLQYWRRAGQDIGTIGTDDVSQAAETHLARTVICSPKTGRSELACSAVASLWLGGAEDEEASDFPDAAP